MSSGANRWPVLALVALAVLVAAGAAADEYAARKVRAVAACAAIPPQSYSTGLIFNPPGQQTFFHRAECFQTLAVAERDLGLCGEVRERRSLLFDGSAVSGERCREAVRQRLDEDAAALAAFDTGSLHRLQAVRFERDGNGRDFDLVVVTDGASAGRYRLRLQLQEGDGEPVTVLEREFGFGDGPQTLRLLLRRDSLPPLLDREFTARVELRYRRDDGNRFIYARIPPSHRESELLRSVDFTELPRWRPLTLP